MSETNHVPVSKIRMDGGAQMRAGIDDETVAEYAERYRSGAKMPALVVFNDGENYWLADGFHRLQALLASGTPNALCEINKGTQRDAVLFGCGANASHGLRRTNGDKRRAVGRLLGDEEWSRWTDRRIAQTCGVDNSFVSRLRKEMGGVDEQHLPATRTGTDGKNYPAQRQKPVAKPVEDESTYATEQRPALRVIDGGNKPHSKPAETTRDAEEASISAGAISSILDRAMVVVSEQSHRVKGHLLSQDEALRLRVAICQLRDGIAELEANVGAEQ